jgi:hypothetical protein
MATEKELAAEEALKATQAGVRSSEQPTSAGNRNNGHAQELPRGDENSVYHADVGADDGPGQHRSFEPVVKPKTTGNAPVTIEKTAEALAAEAKAAKELGNKVFKETVDDIKKGTAIPNSEKVWADMGTGVSGFMNRRGAEIRANIVAPWTAAKRDMGKMAFSAVRTVGVGTGVAIAAHGGLKMLKGMTGGEKIDRETGKVTQAGLGEIVVGTAEATAGGLIAVTSAVLGGRGAAAKGI